MSAFSTAAPDALCSVNQFWLFDVCTRVVFSSDFCMLTCIERRFYHRLHFYLFFASLPVGPVSVDSPARMARL